MDLVILNQEGNVEDPTVRALRMHPVELDAVRSCLSGGYHLAASLQALGDKYFLVFARDGLDMPRELWGNPPRRDVGQLERQALNPLLH